MFLADCPARTTLEVVGHTWSVVVVVTLGDGPLRYGELLDRIGGISNKMLTQTPPRLRGRYGELLDRIGGISNKMLTQTPPRLRGDGILTRADGWYELADLGGSLLTPSARSPRGPRSTPATCSTPGGTPVCPTTRGRGPESTAAGVVAGLVVSTDA